MGEKSDLKEDSPELAQVCLLPSPEFPSDYTSDISICLMDAGELAPWVAVIFLKKYNSVFKIHCTFVYGKAVLNFFYSPLKC